MITCTVAIIKYYRLKIFSYQIAELMTLSMFVISFKQILTCQSINDHSRFLQSRKILKSEWNSLGYIVKLSTMLVWFDKSFVLRDLFDDNREMYNFGSISRFTSQNMTGCRALSNSMLSLLYSIESVNTRFWQRILQSDTSKSCRSIRRHQLGFCCESWIAHNHLVLITA